MAVIKKALQHDVASCRCIVVAVVVYKGNL